MSLITDIKIGLDAYPKAIKFIKNNHLRRFYIVPIILNILLFVFGIGTVNEWSETAIQSFEGWAHPDHWEFWGAEVLAATIGFLIWLILKVLFFFLFAFLGGYIVLILMSPLLAYISEITEKKITQTDYPFNFSQLLLDMLRGIRIAIRNFFLETLAMVILFFMSFIPLVGLITAPILFIISSYFYGFSFMDYTCERRRLKVNESISYIRNNKGIAIGNGLLFAAALLIPIFGVSIAGILAIVSSVAATISILEKEQNNSPAIAVN